MRLTPECFAPTYLFFYNIVDTNRIGLLYYELVLRKGLTKTETIGYDVTIDEKLAHTLD